MKHFGLGITKLRRTLLGAGCTIVLASMIFIWSDLQRQSAVQDKTLAHQRKIHAEQALNDSAVQVREIGEIARSFRQLQESGVIGEEQRQQWRNLLDKLQQERQPLRLSHELDERRALNTERKSFHSRLRVQAEVRHETDLLQLIRRLEREISALAITQHCQVTRQKNTLANLVAHCEIELITLLPQSEVQ